MADMDKKIERNHQSWRNSPLQIATVALYDMGYERYWVEARNKLGHEQKVVVWAQSVEAIRGMLAARKTTIDRIEELPRDRFRAETSKGQSFIGKESKELLYKVDSRGDIVIPPDWKLVAEREGREEKAS